MFARSLPMVALVVSLFSSTTLAGPAQPIEARAGAVCGSGIYGELAPILSPYPVAQAFCTSNYPVKCTTVIGKRAASSTTTTTTTTTISVTLKTTSKSSSTTPIVTTTKTTTPKSSTTSDAKLAAWSKLLAQAANVASTLCLCIEAAPTPCATASKTTSLSKSSIVTTQSTTVSTTKSTTASSSTTTKSTTPSSTLSTIPSTTTSTTPSIMTSTAPDTTPSTTPSTTSSTTTTIQSTTTSSAPPAVHTNDAPLCNSSLYEQDNGGCSDNCVCLTSTFGVEYCVSQNTDPRKLCETDDECPQGAICLYKDPDNGVPNECVVGNAPGNACTFKF